MKITMTDIRPSMSHAYAGSVWEATGACAVAASPVRESALLADVRSAEAQRPRIQPVGVNGFASTNQLTTKPAARGVPPRGRPV